MNVINMAQVAYTSSNTTIKTNRGTEYEAFSRVTRKLKRSDSSKDYTGFIHALHENRELWTLMAVNVADSENQLPQQLRAQIFYLAEFTIAHTTKVIAKKESLDALIEINTSIMRGLAKKGDAA